MTAKASLSPITIGLAFFSMFFGSGNLVFPLFLGQLAEGEWSYVTIGFILGGVVGPFLGTLTMIAYKGDTNRFFSSLGARNALIFTTILTAVWIPLGAAPRCINIAYESFASAVPACPAWLFGAIYSLIVWWIIASKTRMMEILGRYLTPALLVSLAALWVMGMWHSPEIATEPETVVAPSSLFYMSLIQGYSTMDLIAAFYFSSSIIAVLRASEKTEKGSRRKSLIAGSVGMVVLALVYVGLIYMAARNAGQLHGLAKEQLLPYLSHAFLGPHLGLITVSAVVLACLTTSIAMLSVYTDFLKEKYLAKVPQSTSWAMIIGLVSSYLLSLLGLETIIAITNPILEICCPLLVLLAVYNLIKRNYNQTVTSDGSLNEPVEPELVAISATK